MICPGSVIWWIMESRFEFSPFGFTVHHDTIAAFQNKWIVLLCTCEKMRTSVKILPLCLFRASQHGRGSQINWFFFLSLALGERSRVQRPEGQDTRETRAQEHWRQGSYKVLAKSAHSGEDRRAFTPRNSVPLPPSAPMTEHEVSLCPALPPGQGGALPIRPNT